jgi:hypothetical protein
MNNLPASPSPLTGLGVTSLVLGNIGLLFFFFPILGIPVSAIGLAFGLVALILPQTRRGPDLRYCIYGVLLSASALTLNTAIALGPSGLVPHMDLPRAGFRGTPEPGNPPPVNN